MKTFKIFGLMTMMTAVLFGLSACTKDFQDDIDNLNEKYNRIDSRVKTLEEQAVSMNKQLNQLSVLATAVESGFYVTQVKTTDDGYELTLNNGRVFALQNGPGSTTAAAPYISMTRLNGAYYWTVNGMLITDASGRPMPATGQTPIVHYNTNTEQWTVSVDGGMTYQNLNVYASIVINDEVLLQVVNNYISQNTTTIISQELLFQIITTYIQENYAKIFNVNILRQVIVNYLDQHYTTIFNYELLEQIFNQYNFEYAAQHIDVDIITSILLTFIQEHKEIFINNDVLFEIISNYIDVNKIDIFSDELIVEVINNYIQNNTDFINIEMMTEIVNNYIDQHQDVIFNNEVFITILKDYVENNYLTIFSQNILNQVINNYVVQNKTTIFNETLIWDIINKFVQNNYTTIIDTNILNQIITNYITVNKNTIINEEILFEVIRNYFQTNYNIIIDETIISQIINNYISEHQTTLIDIDIVRYVVNNYVQQNIRTIFDIDILNQVINNYFEQNQTVINQYVSQYSGIIKSVVVDDEICVVTLNNNQVIQLTVYDAYARVRDRVQSIVVVPNAKGHLTYYYGYDMMNLKYIVTPASMAAVIADKYTNGTMTVEFVGIDEEGSVSTFEIGYNKLSAETDGTLITMTPKLDTYSYMGTPKYVSIALRVKDNVDGGTDYITTFTPIDWVNN